MKVRESFKLLILLIPVFFICCLPIAVSKYLQFGINGWTAILTIIWSVFVILAFFAVNSSGDTEEES